jgi:hypothetical protein
VGRAARLHDDEGHIAVGKPALKLGAGQALGFVNAPVLVSHSELKNRLSKIDGNGSSIHLGLHSFEDLIPTSMKTSTPMWRNKMGESIPSFQRIAFGRANQLENPAHFADE